MRFSHFFIDRPIFAGVISIILTLVGAIAFRALPITEFPEIAPPTVVVNGDLCGRLGRGHRRDRGGADRAGDQRRRQHALHGVAIDRQRRGRESASCSSRERTSTRRRCWCRTASRSLCRDCRRRCSAVGVTVRKSSPDLMLVIHLISPDGRLDQQYISNYATINIKDVITRIDGVGDTIVFGARDYSMRVWLDPAKVQARGLTASDVVAALRAANVQVAAGAINQPPATSPGAFEVAVQTLGRLSSPDQFSEIVVATDPDGRVTRVRDIARVELGAQDYTTQRLSRQPGGDRASAFSSGRARTRSRPRPPCSGRWTSSPRASRLGSSYRVAYNTTEFIQQSVDEVIKTCSRRSSWS